MQVENTSGLLDPEDVCGIELPPGLGKKGAKLIGLTCNTTESHHDCTEHVYCKDVLAKLDSFPEDLPGLEYAPDLFAAAPAGASSAIDLSAELSVPAASADTVLAFDLPAITVLGNSHVPDGSGVLTAPANTSSEIDLPANLLGNAHGHQHRQQQQQQQQQQ